MKWKSIVEDYFTFTRPQRRSILLAVSLIVGCLLFRFSYSYFFTEQAVPADSLFLKEASRLTQPDTSTSPYPSRYNRYVEDDESRYREPNSRYTSQSHPFKGELFPFDPNTLDVTGWKRLGLRDKTIATIQNYLAKGGRFRQPDDIRRIYGLFPDEADRLLPYVRIKETTPTTTTTYTRKEPENIAPTRPSLPRVVDINAADTTAYIALPGIGNKLAARIITFRDRLGGFYSIEQVGETYGLPDSTFQKIKSRLTVSPNPVLTKLNVNTLDANGLKANPYIRWNVANAIVQYRQQHGNYTSLNDLKKIALIDEQLWAKIQPYLVVE
jgi:competence protein ComEA